MASSSSPCPATTADDAKAGWSEWTNSWAQWPNDGKGGNVCTRSITWAYEADAEGFPSVGCVRAYSVYYANFGDGWSLRGPSTAYTDAACTAAFSQLDYSYVFAPDGPDQATSRCNLAFGVGVTELGETGDRVYQCAMLN